MSLLYPLIISSIAGLSTLIGVLPIFINIKQNKIDIFLGLFLSMSVAVMITLSIFELLPEGFKYLYSNYNFIFSALIICVTFIISFFLIKSLSKIIKFATNKNNLVILGILNMLILILHNIPEGIITFISSYYNSSLGLKLSIAIMLHNIPEGLSIAIPIYYGTKSRKKAIIISLIAGLSEPIGGVVGYILLKNIISSALINIFLIIVASLMINLVIVEILPESLKYKKNYNILIGYLIGIIITLISILL